MKFSISFLNICLLLVLFSGDRLKNVIASLLNVSSETFPFLRHSLYQSSVSLLLGWSWCCSFECPILTELKRDTKDQYAATFTFHQNCIAHILHFTVWCGYSSNRETSIFIPGKIFGSALFEQFHFQCIFGYEMTVSCTFGHTNNLCKHIKTSWTSMVL